MAETVETLVTEFRADIKRYEAQLRRQIRQTEAAARKNTRAWQRSNRAVMGSFRNTGVSMRALMVGAAAGFVGTTKVIADFGQAMATVKAVTDATDVQMQKLTMRARELGATTRFSATEAAEGMLFLARAGFEVDQVMGAIEPTLRLAQAGGIGLGDAADIASNVLQAFQLDVSELTRVVDVMAKTTNISNTDIRQFGDAMKLVAPISKAFGVDIEETSAFIGALSDAGMQATLAGTGLRRVMAELQAPTSSTKKILAEYGIAAEDVKISTVGLSGALQVLEDKGFDATRSLEVFGQRGGPAFANAFAAFTSGKVDGFVETLDNAAGSAEKMGAIMDNTLAGAIKRALSRLQELLLKLGELGAEQALIDLFTGIANLLERMAGFAQDVSDTFEKWTSRTRELAETTQGNRDALKAYNDALDDANEKSGYALEYSKSLAAERRKEAVETLKAAQAERQRALELAKAEFRRKGSQLRDPRLGRGGGRVQDRLRAERREISDEVADLEKDLREGEDLLNRFLNNTYEVSRALGTLQGGVTPDEDGGGGGGGSGDDAAQALRDKLSSFLDDAEAIFDNQVELEDKMIRDLMGSRDELFNRTATLLAAEYDMREQAIRDEITNEQKKNQALAILAEERAEAERQLREEVLGGGQNSIDPIERIRAIEEEKLNVLRDAYEQQLITLEEFETRKRAIVEQSEDAIVKARAASALAQTDAYANLFGSMADLARNFEGEQSDLFKTLFAVEKAFAIASSVISIQTGVAKAMSLPFPANLGAAATVAAQGASIIANIRAVQGFRDGVVGLGGPGGPRSDSIPAMLSRGESVVTAAATGKNGALLAAMNAGADVQGNLMKIGGPGSNVNSTLIVQGNVTDDVWPKLQQAMTEQTQQILKAVPGISRATTLRDSKRGLI